MPVSSVNCVCPLRGLRKDFPIAHQEGRYQIHEMIRAHVLVEEHGNGTMRIMHQGRTLDVHAVTSRPVKAAAVQPVPRARQPVTPRPDYPWRTRWPTAATRTGARRSHCRVHVDTNAHTIR